MLEYPEDWAKRLEDDYDEYMGRLYDAVDAEEGDECETDALDLTGTYFCGCSTCERRASWSFLMERCILAYQQGTLVLVDDETRPSG